MADCQPSCPALAKLRGAFPMLKRLKAEGVKKVGVFDTRVSKAGQGIAYLCRELGMECMVGFPVLKGSNWSMSHKVAAELGARMFPLKAGRTAVCYYQFAKIVKDDGGYMLPLGLVCKDTVSAVAQEADRTLRLMESYAVKIATIVVCTGTGTIATGIHLGADAKVIGVSCGMSTAKQVERMKLLAFPEQLNWDFLTLIEPKYDYYTALDTTDCPFRTSHYYDIKAWQWLLKNLNNGIVKHPVMFWNIGV